MWSLKSRLLVGMIGGMIVLLIAFSLIIYHSISHALLNQFDFSLKTSAQILSASVEQDKDKLGFEFDVSMVPEFAGKTRSAYYEFWRNDGIPMGKSPSLGSEDLAQFKSITRSPVLKSFRMKNGQYVRAIAVKFLPRSETEEPNAAGMQQTFTLVVAKDARQLLSQLRLLKYLLSISSVCIIGLACVLAIVVVKQGLKPLNEVAAQIDSIKEDNLSGRITHEYLPAEIIPIQARLNDLLARLETSFKRERAFNADVAHELRTPLAGMRSIIDVTLTRVRDEAEYRSAMNECLDVISKMQAMVDNLLMLARVESGQLKFAREQVKIADLINICWQLFSEKAVQKGLTFENKINSAVICESDAAELSIVFANLLDNAAEYTNPGGTIWITADKKADTTEIAFNNTGGQLSDQPISEIFECFWRADPSRTGTGVHCGLGLALVKRIIEALGGSVRAEVENGTFSIRLILPE